MSVTFAAIPAQACGGPVPLPSGTNELDTDATGSPFDVSSVSLGDCRNPLPSISPTRTVEQGEWGRSTRSVEVGPGAASLLVVNENANKGWVAELDGVELQPVTVDGWRQAYLVPEGAGGTVDLR